MAFNISVLKLEPIKKGSTGLYVSAWQQFLQSKNFAIGAADGSFGNVTDIATRNYQQRNGLSVDGVVDTLTYRKALEQGYLFFVPNRTGNMILNYLNFEVTEIRDLQRSLNVIGPLVPPLAIDGDFGARSVEGLGETYKKIDINFRPALERTLSAATKQKLGTDLPAALNIITEYARRLRQQLSGAQWVNYFPGKNTIADLVSPFRQRVEAFEQALRTAGAKIVIAAVYRPPQRAYLMHYSARISRGEIAPQNVPSFAGVAIDWVHYTNAASVQAARDMVNAYGIGSNPVALVSRHTQGFAIDWEITWEGTLNVKNAQGRIVSIGAPRTSYQNTVLWQVGATYGVIHLRYDPPHWSIDGG
ncbi:peptidoglycan-binding domain-containing protein [Floridanema evergladense]|uniref:Peptidoglycan-binding protein n=1 Tax=Floridaenema evergladense BLCC-F167 TaxID=3153639 RepID=A0ABV4WMT5_9CYAN